MSIARLSPILVGTPVEIHASVLRLDAPLSFWGGVDPQSGRITQVRHPQCGVGIAGTILCLPATIGSSSSSAILLELIRIRAAPAALVMTEPDAILLIGCLVGREMGWASPPAFRLDAGPMASLNSGPAHLRADGRLETAA
ncbi:COG1786 Swiveling domain associated with predicted aconitase [Rhabdaerophilaceae bacterium]